MLWIALHFDRLALDVAARGLDPQHADAVALCDRLQIAQANEAALALGVRPGLKRATALALAPRLHCVGRDEAAERAALLQIAGWAAQFTPRVSLQPPDALLLEVAGSLRLFGGRERLLGRIRAGLSALGFAARAAVAPTALAAWLLARSGGGVCVDDESELAAQLAPLRVELLPAAAGCAATLAAIGSHTIGDLLRLPRNGLARRFGAALLDELDRTLGQQPDPRQWFEAPLSFAAHLELLAQVEHADALLFAARRLLAQLCGWLAGRQAAVRLLHWSAEHDRDRRGRAPTRFELRLSDPTRDLDRLCAALRERLAAVRLPAPAHTLRLECPQVASLASASGSLFPASRSDSENLARLVERLQARLGREQVQRLLLAADHRPEAAYRIDVVDDPAALRSRTAAKTQRSAPAAAESLRVPRPLWLLHEPIALAERDQRPWWRGPLRLLTPPERIESGWWDDRLVQRDYFIAENDQAEWFWIYRVRHAGAGSGWYLQGFFG